MSMNSNNLNEKINVFIVDDSAFYRQTLISLLETLPNIEIIGAAKDGMEAIRFISRSKIKPDVITLDLEMPGMDGISFFRWLMTNNPIPTLIISSLQGGQNALNALNLGAVDFIAKPSRRTSMNIMTIKDELLEKITTIATISKERLRVSSTIKSAIDNLPSEANNQVQASSLTKAAPSNKVVLIGSSTGGPTALEALLMQIPRDFPCPILISQHMPESFTKLFAERLNRLVPIAVKEAVGGERIKPGMVYIAPGAKHLEMYKDSQGEVFISLSKTLSADTYTPSVDVMLGAASGIYGENTLSIILTGMGNDGLEGIKKIKKKGGFVIAESEETALIYGMPKEIIENGLTDKILPLSQIAQAIIQYIAPG